MKQDKHQPYSCYITYRNGYRFLVICTKPKPTVVGPFYTAREAVLYAKNKVGSIEWRGTIPIWAL